MLLQNHVPVCSAEHAGVPRRASRAQALLASSSSRRGALLTATFLLPMLARPARAGGLERYVRQPKPEPKEELLVANALLAQFELQRLAELLEKESVGDAADLRAVLRFGPLRASHASCYATPLTRAWRRQLPGLFTFHRSPGGQQHAGPACGGLVQAPGEAGPGTNRCQERGWYCGWQGLANSKAGAGCRAHRVAGCAGEPGQCCAGERACLAAVTMRECECEPVCSTQTVELWLRAFSSSSHSHERRRLVQLRVLLAFALLVQLQVVDEVVHSRD